MSVVNNNNEKRQDMQFILLKIHKATKPNTKHADIKLSVLVTNGNRCQEFYSLSLCICGDCKKKPDQKNQGE